MLGRFIREGALGATLLPCCCRHEIDLQLWREGPVLHPPVACLKLLVGSEPERGECDARLCLPALYQDIGSSLFLERHGGWDYTLTLASRVARTCSFSPPLSLPCGSPSITLRLRAALANSLCKRIGLRSAEQRSSG